MRRTLCCLATLLMISQSAFAEDARVKLLNPDGTPAVDAKAIAIMKIWSRVDADLKELPGVTMPEGGGTKAAKNEAGVITYDSDAIAVVAQNQAGFVFVPLPLKGDSATMRPWAKLKIDLSAIDPQSRSSKKIAVLWENCFVGNAIRPAITVEQEDPFGQGKMVPKHDWRFDPFVMWSLSLDAKAEQVVNVPPGEVTMVIGDRDIATADWKNPLTQTRASIVRTRSRNQTRTGNEVLFKAPVMKSVRGELFDADVPDWNGGTANGRYVFASPAGPENGNMPEEIAQLFTGLDQGAGTVLDELAKRYASEAGMNYRYGLMPQATAEVKDDDTFEFPCLPPGKYNLNLFLRSGGAVELKSRGATDDKPIVFEVTPQSSTLDLGQLVRRKGPEPKVAAETIFAPAPANDTPAPVQALPKEYGTDPVLAAEQKIKASLAKVAGELEFQGTPLRMVFEELQEQHRVPIRINSLKLAIVGVDLEKPVTMWLPSLTLQSALRHILSSVSDEITFVIRDEMLVITTKADAALDDSQRQTPPDQFAEKLRPAKATELDTGAAFVTQWLRSAKSSEDPAALKKALQAHIEQEFDANLSSRKSELVRLRKLLDQSEEWLKNRQSKRAEIIEKKVAELLEAAPKN